MSQRPQPILGVVTNNPHEVFQRNVIAGVNDVADVRGYEILIFTVPDGRTFQLETAGLSGLLVIANILPDDHLRDLHQTGIPISLVSHRIPNLPVPSVAPNNLQGIGILVEHLVVGCNRRRLVFIKGNMEQSDGAQRYAAFLQEMLRYNLHIPEEFFLQGDFVPAQAAASLVQLVQRTTDFDGLVAADYLMALAAIDVLTTYGLRIPEDVSVVGFGGGSEADAAGLTIVAADVVELGRRAARQLIGQVEGLHIRGLTLLSAELVVRTTSCISSNSRS